MNFIKCCNLKKFGSFPDILIQNAKMQVHAQHKQSILLNLLQNYVEA